MTAVNFSGRVTPLALVGSLTLGRQFSPCLWPGVGAGCLGVGLRFLDSESWNPLFSCSFAWCLREGLRRTEGETWYWNCKNIGFQGLSPTVQLTLYATGISMSKAPKSPPFSALLPLPSELQTHRDHLQLDTLVEMSDRHPKLNTSQTKLPAPHASCSFYSSCFLAR